MLNVSIIQVHMGTGQAETLDFLAGLDRGRVRMPSKPTTAGRMVDACMSPARWAGSVL